MAQLTRAAGALWVEGVDVRFDRLVPRTSRLRFEAPLIRGTQEPLALSAPSPAVAGPAAAPTMVPAATGLTGELTATLDLVTSAEQQVLSALAHLGASPAPPLEFLTPAPAPVAVPAAPPAGPARSRSRTTTRRFSVADVPELIDHAFFHQPPGYGTAEDRFPVVPMTMMVGLCCEAAEQLAPGRVAVGLDQVRALRWLAVEPPTEVRITAAFVDGPDGPDDDRVKVAIEGYTQATVRLADPGAGAYPAPPPPDRAPLTAERAAPHTAEQMYRERIMFHGPGYQGVTAIDTIGDDGVRGAIVVLPAPGAVLDAAGQLLGYWVMAAETHNRVALPRRIERIDFFGPRPPLGTRLDVTLRLREVTAADARADIELGHDGLLWARMSGFTDRRFDCTEELLAVMLFPETNGLAERVDPARYRVREHWQSPATRELVMRAYLNGAERAHYAGLTPLEQRDWLLERVALKDALRAWLWERGAGHLYPIEVPNPTTPDAVVSLSTNEREAVVTITGG
jgi:hypothetical protein